MLPAARRDEFGLLARTFNSMLTGIARREEHIIHQAGHDPLTDLPNRLLVRDRLTAVLAESRIAGGCGAVAMLDLDD